MAGITLRSVGGDAHPREELRSLCLAKQVEHDGCHAALLCKGPHDFEAKVTNVWNNRVVGDQFLAEEDRVTRTNMQGRHRKDSPLVPSGLLGPVTLQRVE